VADMNKFPYHYFAPLSNGDDDSNVTTHHKNSFPDKCLVQVRCGTRFYGYEAFDFDCHVQDIFS